jgi:hypothetical protein
LFSRSKPDAPGLAAQVFQLQAEVNALRSLVDVLRVEAATMSDLVTKRMRRAVAAERAVERHQERAGDSSPASTPPVTPAPPPVGNLWGARARIAARKAREAARGQGGDQAAVALAPHHNGDGEGDDDADS